MSSDGRITLEASANFSRLENAVVKAQAKIASLEKQLGAVTSEFKTGQTAGDQFAKVLRRAAESIVLYRGLAEAMKLVNQALMENIELGEKGIDNTVTLGQATQKVIDSLGGQGGAVGVPEKVEQMVVALNKVGVPLGVAGEVLAAGANALAGTADEVLPLMEKTTTALAKIATSANLEELANLEAGFAPMVQRIPGMDAERALSLLLETRGQARARSLESLGYAAGAVTVAQGLQDIAPEARSQLAVSMLQIWQDATNRLQDDGGRMSQNAAISLLKAIDEVVPDTPLAKAIPKILSDEGLIEGVVGAFTGETKSKLIQEQILRDFEGFQKGTALLEEAFAPGALDRLSSNVKSALASQRAATRDQIVNAREQTLFLGTEKSRRQEVRRLLFGMKGRVGQLRETAIETEDILGRRLLQGLTLLPGMRDPGRLLDVGRAIQESRLRVLESQQERLGPTRERDFKIEELKENLLELQELNRDLIQAVQDNVLSQTENTDRMISTVETTSNASAASAQAGSQKER